MKLLNTIISTALSFMTVQSFAQTPLESLRNLFASSPVSMQCEWKTEVNKTKFGGKSDLQIQGQMYVMKSNGLEVYCNGNTVWTVDESAMEVVIEPCAGLEKDYAANPVFLLTDIDKLFNVKSQKQLSSGNIEYVLEASSSCGVNQADLVLTKDGEVVGGEFTLNDDNVLEVVVTSMKKTEEKPMPFFSPDRKFGADWIVTDLR